MSKIDISSAGPGISGRLAQQASVREDGWQHVLEQAFMAQGGGRAEGGHADLAPGKPFVPEREVVSGHAASPADRGGVRPRSGSPADSGMARTPAASQPSAVAVRSGDGAVSAVPRAIAGRGMDACDVKPMDETAALVRLAWSAYASSFAVSGTSAPLPNIGAPPPAAAAAAAPGSEASPQHVFLERTEQGAVIWVRDVQATPAQLRQLVNALLRQSRSSGVSVCGLRINGTPADLGMFTEPTTLFEPEAPAPNGPPVLSRRHTHGH